MSSLKVPKPLIVVLIMMASACSAPRDVPFIEQLVDRFDVPACDNVSLVSAGREPRVENAPMSRVYIADDRCVEGLKDAFAVIGFTEIEPSVYRYSSDQAGYETVTLERSDAKKEIGIKWETYEQ